MVSIHMMPIPEYETIVSVCETVKWNVIFYMILEYMYLQCGGITDIRDRRLAYHGANASNLQPYGPHSELKACSASGHFLLDRNAPFFKDKPRPAAHVSSKRVSSKRNRTPDLGSYYHG